MKDQREFIGRAALEAQREAGLKQRLVGLVLEDRGILRAGQAVSTPEGPGITTSGGFSPTLERAIAFARIPLGDSPECSVDVRGKQLRARVVKAPFVRQGKACDGIL
jgi:aminomethyltransferase